MLLDGQPPLMADGGEVVRETTRALQSGVRGDAPSLDRVVAIVGSAGSLPVMKAVLAGLRPSGRAAVFLCYHRAGTAQFDWGPYVTGYRARPALDGTRVEPDVVYHPDRSQNMTVRHGLIRSQPTEERPRPSIDKLLDSLAAEYGSRMHAFLLSGMGSDGVAGLGAVLRAGGTAFVEHPDSASFPALPRRAIAAGVAQYILGVTDLVDIASRIASGHDIPALRPSP